jgi:hypothetical protein
VLTKAIIQSIDYTKNMCRVRIPLFENASRNVNMIEANAQINIVPGIYNSYKTGDIVFIGFEENKMELPVILGKLFVSASDEASSHRGNVSGNSLSITDTAQLPYSTLFDFSKIAQNNKLYNDFNTPKKLADSIIDLQRTQAQTQKYQTIISVAINGNTYKLYLKTTSDFTYSPDKSDEPLYRLCTALKNSQVDTQVIPLEMATTETVVNKGTDKEDISYATHKALLQVKDFTASTIKLKVVIDDSTHFVIKDTAQNKNDIQSIQSFAIYY